MLVRIVEWIVSHATGAVAQGVVYPLVLAAIELVLKVRIRPVRPGGRVTGEDLLLAFQWLLSALVVLVVALLQQSGAVIQPGTGPPPDPVKLASRVVLGVPVLLLNVGLLVTLPSYINRYGRQSGSSVEGSDLRPIRGILLPDAVALAALVATFALVAGTT
jgi:hypothetical protein